jgi:hypothetical protein
MEEALVLRESAGGETLRTVVIEPPYLGLALKDWVTLHSDGRIKRYRISTTGRHASKRFLAEDEALRAGMSEEANPFAAQHGELAMRTDWDGHGTRLRVRYNATESSFLSLARRRYKTREPFLSSDLVAAGERSREDFQLAQLGPRVAQNWDRFLTAGGHSDCVSSGRGGGSEAVRKRIAEALSDLGPGLGDVVLLFPCGDRVHRKANGMVGAVGQDRAAYRFVQAEKSIMTRGR